MYISPSLLQKQTKGSPTKLLLAVRAIWDKKNGSELAQNGRTTGRNQNHVGNPAATIPPTLPAANNLGASSVHRQLYKNRRPEKVSTPVFAGSLWIFYFYFCPWPNPGPFFLSVFCTWKCLKSKLSLYNMKHGWKRIPTSFVALGIDVKVRAGFHESQSGRHLPERWVRAWGYNATTTSYPVKVPSWNVLRNSQ